MMIALFVELALLLSSACATVTTNGVANVAGTRAQVQQYLESVYSQSDFSPLSDAEVFAFHNSLTFYYEGYPTTPNWPRRKESHPYAGTVCDCLHLNLTMCQTRPAACPFWPVTSFLTMEYVQSHQLPGFPANVWVEGLTFPGEWGFPLSCTNRTLGRTVYAWHHTFWLYPETGTGVWFNTGNTAPAYNKVAWLIAYGSGLGSTLDQKMHSIVSMVCTGYQNLTTCAQSCTDPQKSDPTYCCCHGRHGRNLGTQVYDVKSRFGYTWQQALITTANYYVQGMFGDGQQPSPYPVGTFFAVLDTLDSTIKREQSSQQFDSVQLLREPQHGGYHSQPDYAFEILQHSPFDSGYYRWSDYCTPSQMAIAVLDPLQDVNHYMKAGYVGANVTTKRIDAFKPRPEFAALFQTN